MDLFRKEAIEHQASRLLGEIGLAQPIGWLIATAVIVAAVAGAAAALLLIQVPRIERVPAQIEGRSALIHAPAGTAVGTAVRIRPDVVGDEIGDIAGVVEAISAGRTVGPIGGVTASGRRARVRLAPHPLTGRVPATATVLLGRQSLGAALS